MSGSPGPNPPRELTDAVHQRPDPKGPEDQAALLSSGNAFRSSYHSWHRLVLAPPLTELEQVLAHRVGAALEAWLGLDSAAAAHQARRWVLFRRVHLLHETLTLELAPDRLAQLLDTVAIEGLEHLRGLRDDQGILLISVHYSLYSSLLELWLARAAARGLFRHLTLLFIPASAPEVSARRKAELESAGLIRRGTTTLLLTNLKGSLGVTRQLLGRLQAGEVVLVLPDARLLPGADARALSVTLGQRRLGVPRGAAWLAQMAHCPIVPVHIRPHEEDRYILTFGPPAELEHAADAPSRVQSMVQSLLDQTVLADPGPWDAWQWIPDGGHPPARA